jgi:translation initiation factor IF-1
MVKNIAGGNNGKKVARKHTTKGKNELRLSKSDNEKYAIVKKLLGNTCDVICEDGVDRRCIIRGKFTGRNKRDNMIDSGTYILIGLREWVDEDNSSRSSSDKNIKYCDLLEVYNSMERDILRRTHNIFSSIKDESINKYEDREMNVAFVDENTLKYQNMIKNMEQKKGNKNSGISEDSGDNDDDKGELINQTTIITTSVKHVGKGIVIQSYDISDNDDDDDGDDGDDGDGNKYDNKAIMDNRDMDHIGDKIVTKPNTSCNTNKKIVYESDNIINVDDI